MHLEENSLSGYAMQADSVRMRFLYNALLFLERNFFYALSNVLFWLSVPSSLWCTKSQSCCRLVSSSNNSYQESATVMQWYINKFSAFTSVLNLHFTLSMHACWFIVFYSFMKQVCHRDLKLENTLLDGSPAPRLKICDFGYSKVPRFPYSRVPIILCVLRSLQGVFSIEYVC